MINSLLAKIMGSYALIPVLILLGLLILLPHYLENYMLENREDELKERASLMKQVLETEGIGDLDHSLTVVEQALDGGIIIVDSEGQIRNCGRQMERMLTPGASFRARENQMEKRHQRMMSNNGGSMHGRGHHHHHISQEEVGPGDYLEETRLWGQEGQLDAILAGKTVSFRGESPMLGRTIIATGVPLGNDLALILVSPLHGLQEMVQGIRNLTLQITLGAVLLALLIGYFLARGIVRPIKKIKAKAAQMAEGNFRVRLEELPQDEIGELGADFNYLAAELEAKLAELNTEKNRVQSMLNGMAEGALGISTRGKILLANPKLQEIFSVTEELIDKQAKDYFPSELLELINKAVKQKEEVKLEFEYQDKILAGHGAPIYRTETELWGAIVLVRDVTQLRELEKMRRLFVANVSHELKTPLTSVQGYIEAVRDGMVESKEQKQKYLDRVLDETDRMSRLVGEILDLSRLQSGQIEFEKNKFNLIKVIKSALTDLSTKLGDRKLVQELPKDCLVIGDRDRIQEVLLNLLENAIKFTAEAGEIKVKVEKTPEEAIVHIIDDGIGIPPAEQDYIWERFHQVDRSRSPGGEGTGLGLAIVKEIIEELDGEVKVKSEMNKGSDFMFSLPRFKQES